MTNEKQEKKTFKYGDQEYALDDLLKLHAQQEQNFYNFAKTRGQYDDSALMGLRKALIARIDAAKNGESFDGDGVLGADKVDNIQIQTQKKGLFKKDKYVDQDNTEWAKYYFNKLMEQIKPYQSKKTVNTGAWDINKHGLEAYLTGQGLNAKEIFENNDLRDEENPDNPRAFNQRHELLREHLTRYKDWLTSKGFDFTKNENEWDDTFLSDLNNLLNSEKFDNNLAASLRKLGAGDAYTTAFTSDKYDLSETSADAKNVKAEKERKDQIKAYNDVIANHYSIYEGLAPQTAQMHAYMGQPGSNFFRTPEEIREWSINTKGIDMNAYQQRYDANKFDAEAAQYILPLLQSNGRLQKTNIDGVEYVYDPASIDRQNYSFVAINPVTGSMEQKFLYDIEHESSKLRNKYLNPQGVARYQLDTSQFKEGGVISMQTGGSFNAMTYLKQLDNQNYQQRAAAQGITEKELKEAERTPFGDETIINNSQFTGNDMTQLITMGVNLGSMFLDPLSGAAVGAGASTVDFINDINRDGFQGKDAWNYVKNLGMDALGVLPVIGDTFGTLGKVKKGLFQLAPKIIGYLGMAQGVMNSPQIIDSFTKILDEREMTTADWQNIANGINLIVSGTRMGKHAIKDARAKKASLQQNQLQVEVTDKSGNSKLLVLDGDNAKAVRDSDHSVESVEKIIKNIEGMQDYTVNPKSSLLDFSLRMPGKMVKDPTTGGEKRSWNPFETSTQKANVQAVYDPVAYARAYHGKPNSVFKNGYTLTDAAIQNKYGNKNQVDGTNRQNSTQFEAKQKGRVEAYLKSLKDRAKAHAPTTKLKEDLETVKGKITTTQSDIDAKNQSYQSLETTKNKQTQRADEIELQRSGTGRKDAIDAIRDARAKIKTLEAEIAAIHGRHSARRKAKKQAEIDALLTDIQTKQDYLKDNSRGNLVRARQAALDAESKMTTLTVETKKLQRMLKRLNKNKTNLETSSTTHSTAFERLLNFKPVVRQFNGKDYTFGTAQNEADLLAEGLFKQGGSINRNKINKFLNYGKR